MEFQAGTLESKMRGLNTIVQTDRLDNRASYGFYRMAPILEAEYRAFEDARRRLIEEHGERDEVGELMATSEDESGQFLLKDPDAFQIEYEKLASEMLTVNVQPVKLSMILESEGFVNAATLIQLGELILDDVETESNGPPL
jgi:hypothetical protein